MALNPFAPVRRSHWRRLRKARPLRRRFVLEVEALEDRTVLSTSPLAIFNAPPSSFFGEGFSFHIASNGKPEAPSSAQEVRQTAYVELELGGNIDASALRAILRGTELPVTLATYDAAGTPSLAVHPLTGQPLANDPQRAETTLAFVDCSSIDLSAGPPTDSITFTGARTLGTDDAPIVAQGFVHVETSDALPAPVTVAAPAVVSRELIVVNANVVDADALIASLTADASKSTAILKLDGTTDGVRAVADFLRETGETFSAIHLLGHGGDDAIQLGSSTLTLGTINTFARSFMDWGEFLSADADILIYGCDVASSQAGRDLVNRVANLTGADVAASIDATGSQSKGGNWTLEYASGQIDVAIPFTVAAEQAWDGLLGLPPVQTFIVPLSEANIRTAFVALYPSTGAQMNSVISLATSSPNTIITYDQWEDGYEADLANPTQSTTQVWGDGNLANGVAPGFATDIIPVGGVVVLQNVVTLPRDPAIIQYDGGDIIGATKAIAVTRAAWATNPGTVMGTAVDVYDTSKYGTAFQVPVGQNTPNSNSMFEYTSLIVQASQDGTVIQIDRDGNGTVDISTTLNKGQTYQVNGGVLQGATLLASKPVQAHLITGDVGATYESRSFTLAPTNQWSNSYYSPVATTSTTSPLAIFLYNPGTSAITVSYQTLAGSGTFSIAAKGTYRFDMPLNSAAHFFTLGGQPFYAVGTMDADASNNSTNDWGFRLVPESSLTPAALVGWGPGSSDLSANGSPIWVTATNATRVYVDFDGNPTTGLLTDPNGDQYDQHYDVSALQSLRIYDPDKNQTGMRVYTTDGTLITAAWGQDPSVAGPANPFLDMGTIIPPLPVSSLKKTAVVGDINASGNTGPGDTITYHITVRNDGVVPLGNVVVTDIVPIGTTYVAGSTVVTGSSTFTGPVADQVGAATAFPLDNLGGLDTGINIGNIPVGGSAIVTFVVTINNTGLPSTGIQNDAAVNTDQDSLIISVNTPLGSTPGQVVFAVSSGSMTQAPAYGENVPIYLTVTDPDPNRDPAVVDTLTVIVTNPATGDRETVLLTETGVNTGIFAATIASSTSGGLAIDDGIIAAHAGDTLTVNYTDPLFTTDTSSDTVVISAPSVIKQLYLSDEGGGTGQNLDRVDPTKSGTGQTDTTTVHSATLSNVGSTDTIAVAATTSGSTTNATSLTFAHTPGAGNNRLLLVAVSLGGTSSGGSAGTVSGVTFGGTALTLVNTITSNAIKVYIYSLVNPSAAAGNVVVSVTGASSIVAEATTFNNVDQTTPLGTSVSNSSAGATSGNVVVTSATGELVFAAAAWDEGGTNQSVATVATGSQTELVNFSGFDFVSMATSTKPGAASVTSSFTAGDNQEYGAVGVPIKPSTTPATSTATFTQTPAMASNLILPAGGTINVVTYVNVVSGSMPANPNITATLRYGATTFATLTNPVYNSIAGTLTWTLTLGSPITIPAGQAVSLDVTTAQSGVTFQVQFDSTTKPSRIDLPTTTFIDVTSVGVFDAPFTNDGNSTNDGNAITTTFNGQTVYIRAIVTDPFGPADITSQTLTITPPSGAPFSLAPISILPTGTANQKIYEYAWTTSVTSGNFGIAVRANEGFENTIFDTGGTTFQVTQQDTGTPSVTIFTDSAGTKVTQYAPNATVYVQTTDIDQNTNPAVVETVIVTVTTSSGDTQTLTLTETGVNTGVFRASVLSSTVGGGSANDGTLNAPDPSTLFVTYTDPNDPADQSGDTALVRSTPPPANNPPTANNDTGTTNQNTVLTIAAVGVLGNDTDPDSDPLVVAAVNGSAASVGSQVTLASGALVTLNANGSYSYNPNGQFNYLALGQNATDSFAYTITDSQGGFSSATVTITINGLNDAPTSTPIPNQANLDSQLIAVNVAGSFADIDNGDPLTLSATGLPPGLTIVPVSGLISGTLTNSASQGGVGGVYSVTITATDSQGLAVSQTFTWTITNPAPTATNNSGTVTEDTTLTHSGNMIADNDGNGVDNDPDNDPLSIAQVQFGATVVNNPAVNIDGAYGTLDWNSDGTYTYTLNNSLPAVQALNAGDSLTEVFTYTLSDGNGGTATANLTITINGVDEPPTITIDDVTRNEAAGTMTFTVTLNTASAQTVTVNFDTADNSATAGADYTATSGVLTFNPGDTTQTITVSILNDTVFEGSESFFVNLSAATNGIISDAQGVGTILDDGTGPGGNDDDRPNYTVDDVTRNEAAGTMTFTVTLNGDTNLSSTVNFDTADNTATAGDDYTSTSGTLTFAAGTGARTQSVTVSILNDSIFELSETFFLNLSAPTNATITDAQGIGTILDDGTGPGGNDDDRPTLSVADVTVTEGLNPFAVFTVSLSNPSTQATSFILTLTNGSALGGGTDYGTAGAGNLEVSTDGGLNWIDATAATIPALATSVLVRTPIVDDALNEATENFTLTATVTAGPTVNPFAVGTGIILDNDIAPSLSIDDITVNEAAGTATFTVTLSAASGQTVTVDFATSDDTATAGADYTAISSTLTFIPGSTTATIIVPILNDSIFENSEAYNVNLTNPTNATIADNLGIGTILDNGAGPGGNDNDTPTLSVSSVTVTEGTDPFAVFIVSLSNPSTQATAFDLALANVSAVGGGVDYGTAGAGNLQVSTDAGLNWIDATAATISPLDTSVLVRTPVVDDLLNEATETFTLTATVTAGTTTTLSAAGTGTILDTDPVPSLAIDDITVNETAGTATFTVTLNAPSGQSVTVAYATVNGSATAPSDYSTTSGTLTFAPGTTTQTITVAITNDTTPEPTEFFTVILSAPTNASIADDTGIGTILDNDPSIDKLAPAQGTYAIGDIATYDLVVTLAEGLTQDLVVTDDLPAGMVFSSFTIVNANGITNGAGVLAPVGFTAPTLDGQDAVFSFGAVTTPVGPAANTFTIRLSAVVNNIPGNQSGVILTNNSNLQYTDGALGTQTTNDPTPVDVTVAEPFLAVVKSADDATPHLGQTVTYTLTINHTQASGSTAYDLALADTLPAGLTLVPGSLQIVSAPAYVSLTDTSTGNQAAGTLNRLDLGDTIVLRYQAVVSSNPAIIGGSFGGNDDSLTNTANVNYDTQPSLDPNQRTYAISGSQIVTIVGGDLAVTKSDAAASVTPGSQTSYTITVTNNGTDTATGIVIDDTLPPQGATFNAALSTVGGTIDAQGHLIYNLASLAAGATQTFTVVLDIAAVVPAGLNTLVNSVVVTQTDIDPTPADNTATDTDTVNATPDLALTKDDGVAAVQPGDTITYTLTLRNAGNQDATGVAIADSLPPNTTFVAASDGGVLAGNVVTWTIGALAGGNAQTITRTLTVRLNATVPAGVNQLINTVTAQDDGTNGLDPNSANNTATDTDTVNAAPDLVVTKTNGSAAVQPGQAVTYTITIQNVGNQDATGVVVTDTLPAVTTFVSASDSGTFAVGVVSYPAFSLAAGATATRTVTVQVPATFSQGTVSIINTATARDDGSNGPDPTPGNNTGTDIDSVGPDLELVKLVTPDSIYVGRIVTYTFIINNLGPVAATGVFVDDPFPPGLEFISAGSPTRGSFDLPTNRWTIGTMQPNTTERLTITARIRTEGPIINSARTGLVEIDPNLTNNSSSALSVGLLRPGTDVSKRLFLSTPVFEDDLPIAPGSAQSPAAIAAANAGFVAFPFATPPVGVAPRNGFSALETSTVAVAPNSEAPPTLPFVLASSRHGTPGIVDEGAGDASAAGMPFLGDLFGFDEEWRGPRDGQLGRAFEFDLPLSNALFEEGVEIADDSGVLDDVFAQGEDPFHPWESMNEKVEAKGEEPVAADTTCFGQEVLDEVGVPPILALEDSESASLWPALAVAPLLALALRDNDEQPTRKRRPTVSARK